MSSLHPTSTASSDSSLDPPSQRVLLGMGSNSEFQLCFLSPEWRRREVAHITSSSTPHRFTSLQPLIQDQFTRNCSRFPSFEPSSPSAGPPSEDDSQHQQLQSAILSQADLRNLHIVKAVAGSRTSFLIDINGQVYTCGYNGEMGRGRTGTNSHPSTCYVKRLARVQFPPPQEGAVHRPVCIRDIVSYTHTLFITEDGVLYVAGDNEMGELGTGDTISMVQPVKLEFDPAEKHPDSKITMAAVGYKSSYVVTDYNELLVFGNNNCSQLMTGNKSHCFKPKNVHFDKYCPDDDIVKIRTGDYYVTILTRSGRVWQSGNIDWEGIESAVPQLVPVDQFLDPDDRVVDIECGCYFRVYMTAFGHIYFCGSNSMTQIGTSAKSDLWSLWLSRGPRNLHTHIRNETDIVYNDDNDYGDGINTPRIGKTDPIKTPTKLSDISPRFRNITPKSIHAGHMALCVYTTTGKLMVFGNIKESFGEYFTETPLRIGSEVTALESISVGRDHMLLMMRAVSNMDKMKLLKYSHIGRFSDCHIVSGVDHLGGSAA